MSAEACLDPLALDKLDKLGGAVFVLEMIDLFFDYAPTRLAAAEEALQAGNLAGVEHAVHPLKTSSGHIGACRVHRLAMQIEELTRARQGETIPALLAELEAAYLEAKPLLQAARAARA